MQTERVSKHKRGRTERTYIAPLKAMVVGFIIRRYIMCTYGRRIYLGHKDNDFYKRCAVEEFYACPAIYRIRKEPIGA